MPGQSRKPGLDRDNPRLQVNLLGHPTITWHGELLEIPRARVRALLYYLAAHRQPLARSELCYLFWPDKPDPIARRNLSHHLTHLRRALPPDMLLIHGPDHVQLDDRRVASDLHSFENACRQALEAGAIAELEGIARRVPTVILAGFELSGCPNFDTWIEHQRRQHQQVQMRVLNTLVASYAERGDPAKAIEAARGVLEIDPLNEDVHRSLIDLFIQIGDISSAIRQFRSCAEILRQELAVEPSPETWASYRSIQRQVQPDVWEMTRLACSSPARQLELPFVGRAEAIAEIDSYFDQAPEESPSAVLISGEPGIGKSTLLNYFNASHRASALILSGAGNPGAVNIPYHTILQLLRSCDALDEALGRLAPQYQELVALILPEARKYLARSFRMPAAPPREAQPSLFEALWQILLLVTEGQHSAVLCIDDLHWTDRTSMACLTYFTCRNGSPPFQILATFRTGLSERIGDFRRQLLRRKMLAEIQLQGLGIRAIREIAQSLDLEPDDLEEFSQRLQEISGGNPLFLAETVAALYADLRPLSLLRKLDSLNLPGSLNDAILRRLEGLPRIARQVLDVGAVLGTEFDFELVLQTTGRDEFDTTEALECLIKHQILDRADETYRFRHHLLQRAALEAIEPAHRRILDRRAAKTLVRMKREDHARTAQHYLQAAELADAIHYFLLAAEGYQQAFAWHEAEIQYTQCLELLDRPLCDWSATEILNEKVFVLAQRARMRQLQGDLAGRNADLQAMIELNSGDAANVVQLPVTTEQIHYLNLEHRFEAALELGENALPWTRQAERHPAWPHFLIELGTAYYEAGRPLPALEIFERALEPRAEHLDPRQAGEIHHFLARLHSHLGQMPDALLHLQQALRLHSRAGDQLGLFMDQIKLSRIHLKLGNLESAEEACQSAEALSAPYRSPTIETTKLSARALLDLHQGAYAQAATGFMQAWDLHDSQQAGSRTSPPEPILLGWSLAQFHLGSQLRALARIKSETEGCYCRQRGGLLVALGLHQLAAGHPTVALRCFNEALTAARDLCGCVENQVLAQAGLARASTRLGRAQRAITEARKALDLAADLRFPHCVILARYELAAAYHRAGQVEAGLAAIQAALDISRDHLQAWLGNEQLHALHARLLRSDGHARAAERALHTAREIHRSKASAIRDADQRRAYLQANSLVP